MDLLDPKNKEEADGDGEAMWKIIKIDEEKCNGCGLCILLR